MEFAIPEQDKQAFDQYYAQKIAPKCRRYESVREAAAARYKERRKIVAPLTFIGIPAFLLFFAMGFYGALMLNFKEGVFLSALAAPCYLWRWWCWPTSGLAVR